MSQMSERQLPEGFVRGPVQGSNIIGEVTESLHRFLLDGWTFDRPPPRIEEDLSFVPKDREEVLYVWMYRASQNTDLQNAKHWRPAKVTILGEKTDVDLVYWERPPLYLDLFYMVAVHSRFRSDAERLMGWVLMRLYDATHLVYRPRRYILPDGKEVDSTGSQWDIGADGDEVIMEKVGLALYDDLTIGDAINFFTINEAPYRPYLTYRARCAMEGSLIAAPPTTVRHHRTEAMDSTLDPRARPGGRFAAGRMDTRPTRKNIGPPGHGHRPIEDTNSED